MSPKKRKGKGRRRVKKSRIGYLEYTQNGGNEVSYRGIEATLREPEPQEPELPVFSLVDANRLKTFRCLWGGLSPQQREIMLLVTDGGLTSPTLIAERLNLKRENVVTQFKRIRKKIEKALAEGG